MSYTAKQHRRARLSDSLRQWFGTNKESMELDANNRAVEKKKRRQYAKNNRKLCA